MPITEKNYVPLSNVIQNISNQREYKKQSLTKFADDFEKSSPDRIDFQLARLFYVPFHIGTTYTINKTLDADKISKILNAASFAIENNASCKDDILRVIALTRFKSYKNIGYKKDGNRWSDEKIFFAMQKLNATLQISEISSPKNKETLLFNDVLLPSIRVLIQELLTPSKKVNFNYLAKIISLFNDAFSKLSYFSNGAIKLTTNNLLYDVNNDVKLSPCNFIESDRFTTALLVDVGYILELLLSTNIWIDPLENDNSIKSTLIKATKLQKTCWLTNRKIRENLTLFNNPNLNKKIKSLRTIELTAIKSLSFFEQLMGNFENAANYAALTNLLVTEIYPVDNSNGSPPDWIKTSFGFSYQQCMVHPNYSYLKDKKYTDSILWIRSILIFQEKFRNEVHAAINNNIISNIEQLSSSLGHNCIYALLYSNDPIKVRVGFILGYHLGFLVTIEEFFNPKNSNKEELLQRKELLLNVAALLSKEDFLNFVIVIGNLAQRNIVFLNLPQLGRLIKLIRSFWKRLNPKEQIKITSEELVYIHHVQNGLSLNAIQNNKANESARRIIIKDKGQKDTYINFDNFAEKLIANELFIIKVEDFYQKNLTLDPTSVFVSFATLDGNILSVYILTDNSPPSVFIVPSLGGKDWHKILAEYRKAANSELSHNIQLKKPNLLVETPLEIYQLVEKIINEVFKKNSSATRILIHCSKIWDIVPWQFIIKNKFSRNAGRPPHLSGKPLVVWRINGIYGNNESVIYEQRESLPSTIISDDANKICKDLGDKLRTQQRLYASPRGHLTFVAHGSKTAYTHIKLFGKAITSHELMDKFMGYDVVVLHTCSAADVIHTEKTGDTGGLPSLFLSHGSSLVIAPPLPISLAVAENAEAYFRQIDHTQGLRAIENHYLNAISENPNVALYTLFSDELVAPRFVADTPALGF